MENQLTILSESLDKKLEVLQKIREYNKRQEEIFSAEKVDMSLFDDAVEEKQRLIDEVVRLDEGFEILYEKLAKELEGNRQRYAVQIKELQAKVAKAIEDALMADDRVLSVEQFSFTKGKRSLLVKFTVTTTEGDVESEFEFGGEAA